MSETHSNLFANICKENSWKVLENLSENSANPEWEEIDWESLEYVRSLVTEALTDDNWDDYVSQIFTALKQAELNIIDMNDITATPERATIKLGQFLRDYFAETAEQGYTKWPDWMIDNGYDYEDCYGVVSDSESDSDDDRDDDSDDDDDSDSE